MFLRLTIVFASILYITGLIRLWRKAGLGRGVSIWRAASFLGAMILLVVALIGMDGPAEEAFSMHMVQHMLLMKVIAPLLLLGEFSTIFMWAIDQKVSQPLVRSWKRSSRAPRFWKQLTMPWMAWTLFALCLWFWHFPVFYQAALENEFLHDAEHLLFLSTSLLFWWYIVQNGHNAKVRYGAAVLYLFTTMLQESTLGALLTFSSNSWFTPYLSSNLWGLSALADQQLAGMIMWIPGGILFMGLIVWYFGLWLQHIEKRMSNPQAGLAQSGDSHD